jgi:hypothetical protein
MSNERERAYLTPLPRCVCGKPATQELRNGVNAKIGQHCDRCAGPALARFAKGGQV